MLDHREPVVVAFGDRAPDFVRRVGGVDPGDFETRRHDIGHLAIAELEGGGREFLFADFDDALLGALEKQHPQLFLGDRSRRGRLDPEEPKHQVSRGTQEADDGRARLSEDAQWSRHEGSDPFRVGQGHTLRDEFAHDE